MEFKSLPDIASEKTQENSNSKKVEFSQLTWVGMEKIQLPLFLETAGPLLSAEVRAQVNLIKGKSRGIHMSRLYQLLSQKLGSQVLSWRLLEELAEDFILSQNFISNAAKLTVQLQFPVLRTALKSELQGWRLYPVQFEVEKSLKGIQKKLSVEVLYSSTCPASSALSLELWKEDMEKYFSSPHFIMNSDPQAWLASKQLLPGSPHAQRSVAKVMVQLQPQSYDLGPLKLINGIEEALRTPVQTAVKRIDEQEFARLNAQNPLFCEDAARAVQTWLDSNPDVACYSGFFEHQESLHPHNAVAVIEKCN